MPRRQKNVSTADVRRETDKRLGKMAEKERKSKRQFVMNSLDWLAIKDDLIRFHFPKLSKAGETGEGWPMIKDEDRPDVFFIVKLKDDKLICIEDNSMTCDHIKFVLALPEIGAVEAKRWEKAYHDAMKFKPELKKKGLL